MLRVVRRARKKIKEEEIYRGGYTVTKVILAAEGLSAGF